MTPNARQVLRRLALLCACLGMGAVAYLLTGGCEVRGQGIPPLPRVFKHAKGVTRGAGAALLLWRAMVVPPVTRTNVFAWRYAPGQSNYWWALQASSDLRTWTTVASNVTGDLEVRTTKTNNRFWRLKGQNAPY